MRRLQALTFGAFFTLFFITSSGGFDSGDAVTRLETAKSWLAGNGGALPHGGETYNATTKGRNGEIYTAYGPFQSLLMLPLLAAFKPLPVAESTKDGGVRLAFNLLLLPFLSALGLVLLIVALSEMGFSHRVSFLSVLIVGLATPYWHYARSAQEENLVAFGLVAWLLGMNRFANGKLWGLLAAAAGASMALATRWAAAATLLPILVASVVLLRRHFKKEQRGELASAFGLCTAAFLALLAFNRYRFGSLFETGYGLIGTNGAPLFQFADPVGKGVALLFSPYRGLFVYAPVILLAGLALAKTPKAHRLVIAAGFSALCSAFLLNTCYGFWNAGHSWGPRLIVAPLVLLAPLFAVFLSTNRARAWILLVLLSFSIQVFSVLLPSSTEDQIRDQNGLYPLDVKNAWICEDSAPCARPTLAWTAFKNSLPGAARPERAGMEPFSETDTLFWWPFRFSFRLGYFNAAVAWLIVATSLSVSGLLFLRASRVSKL